MAGWVTLSLRETELIGTRASLTKRDLDITREKRQYLRQAHYEQSIVRTNQTMELANLKYMYNIDTEALQNALNTATKNGTASVDGQDLNATEIQNLINKEKLNYESEMNAIKTRYESELALLEQEASEREADYDQEKTQIETELEVITAELEAIGEAVSSRAQSDVISLP